MHKKTSGAIDTGLLAALVSLQRLTKQEPTTTTALDRLLAQFSAGASQPASRADIIKAAEAEDQRRQQAADQLKSKERSMPTIPIAAGERYIGGIVSADGTTTHTILLPVDIEANWNDAMAWAKEQGGDLPTRVEQALMLATAKDEFEPCAYWSNQSESGWAWYQFFSYGNQSYGHESYELRARAVRRLVI